MRILLRNMRKIIEALFPKTRADILTATLMHADKWWYLSDLAKHLQVSPSNLQRELISLVKASILIRKVEGNRVYYKADPNCPILLDLQNLLIKTSGLVDVIQSALSSFKSRIEFAFIFGSIASGDEISTSDVDLLVVGGSWPSRFNA
jgi:DNA-binding transcriptional ArsR family regulator